MRQWTLNRPDLFRRLVRSSNWTVDDYQVWLAGTLCDALLADG